MDITYLFFLQNIREASQGILDSFMLQITTAGEAAMTYLLLAAIYWCVDKRAGQYMGFNVALGCTLNQFLKNICRIERPWVRDERIRPVEKALSSAGGYSFPSGHTSRAAAVWGALGTSAWKGRAGRGISLLCWGLVAAVAFSRNYLGVHTPQDVLVSLLLGILLLFIIDWVLNWVEKHPGMDILIGISGCILCFLPMLRVGCLSNAGAGMGFLLGWLVERRAVRFRVEGAAWQRCLRFGIGGLLLLTMLTSLHSFLALWMPSRYAGFFSTFVAAFFIMAVYPYFIKQHADGKKIAWKAAGSVAVVLLLGTAIAFTGGKIRQQAEIQAGLDSVKETGPVREEGPAGRPEEQPAQAEERQMKIIGHRGYSSVYPENTMSSFAGAIDIGTDLIELDVQQTKDGQIVIFHDNELSRITGQEGAVADYTIDELRMMDAGSWFHPFYEGENIPLLEEALSLIKDSGCNVYLELKDIGENNRFVESVLDIAEESGMKERCLFASFNDQYLAHLKELDPGVSVLYNTLSGLKSLPDEYPADYYGLWIETASADTIKAIHNAGKQAYVWTVNTPEEMQNARRMGADGVVTNYPGMAGVLLRTEYSYLAENYEASLTLPGLYGPGVTDADRTMVVQGLAKVKNYVVVSAYSKEEYNSILYIMNPDGQLQKTVDLQFRAHTGGISYDELHDLLWITGAQGHVYALSWTEILDGTYKGVLQADFDAGLRNHSQAKVASFLTIDEGELYVGSYVDGAPGTLHRYKITDVKNPELLSVITIPERIQGITFQRDMTEGTRYMLLSQSYRTEDSKLLRFLYDEQQTVFTEPLESHTLPEGAEQIQMTPGGLYILFESAARPYRATANIPNDRIYIIRE